MVEDQRPSVLYWMSRLDTFWGEREAGHRIGTLCVHFISSNYDSSKLSPTWSVTGELRVCRNSVGRDAAISVLRGTITGAVVIM